MKLIATDFDGTLCKDGTITAEVSHGIAEWRSGGNFFGIITGRGPEFFEDLRRLKLEIDFLAAHNGAHVFTADGSCFFEASACADILPELDAIAVEHACDRHVADVFENSDGEMRFHQFSSRTDSEQLARQMTNEINLRYGQYVTALHNGRFIDTVPCGVNKATGVRAAAEHFGVKKEDVAVVGDNGNDLAMIEEYNSFAVSNASAEVLAAAKHICRDVAGMIKMLGAMGKA